MTVTVSNTKTQPAIVMDHVHIDSMTFKQARENDPKRVIGISAVLYGLDAEGNKVFDKETFSISDTDFDTTAVTDHLTSGGTLEEFMLAYAAAKADVNAAIAAGTLSVPELMAYFEAALGKILELHGKISISGVQ